jgi:hypothetical protein
MEARKRNKDKVFYINALTGEEDEGEEELAGESWACAARTEEQEGGERDGWWTPTTHGWRWGLEKEIKRRPST